MRKWNRKCGIYGQVGNFDGSDDNSSDNNSTDYSFNSTRHLKSLIQGHATMDPKVLGSRLGWVFVHSTLQSSTWEEGHQDHPNASGSNEAVWEISNQDD